MLASLVVALLASSAAPTPLYAIYQAKWHFTPITTTAVFEHAASVLPSSTADRPLDDDLALAQELLPGLGAVT